MQTDEQTATSSTVLYTITAERPYKHRRLVHTQVNLLVAPSAMSPIAAKATHNLGLTTASEAAVERAESAAAELFVVKAHLLLSCDDDDDEQEDKSSGGRGSGCCSPKVLAHRAR